MIMMMIIIMMMINNNFDDNLNYGDNHNYAVSAGERATKQSSSPTRGTHVALPTSGFLYRLLFHNLNP